MGSRFFQSTWEIFFFLNRNIRGLSSHRGLRFFFRSLSVSIILLNFCYLCVNLHTLRWEVISRLWLYQLGILILKPIKTFFTQKKICMSRWTQPGSLLQLCRSVNPGNSHCEWRQTNIVILVSVISFFVYVLYDLFLSIEVRKEKHNLVSVIAPWMKPTLLGHVQHNLQEHHCANKYSSHSISRSSKFSISYRI